MKTREEKIAEMAYSVCKMGEVSDYITDCSKCGYNDERYCKVLRYAGIFYNAGYRNQSDTVREFVERLKQIRLNRIRVGEYDGIDLWLDVKKLAKEYGVEVEE